MGQKEQLVIMAEPGQVDDLDVLRIVKGTSRAEVTRQALALALPQMLEQEAERIGRLAKVASRQKITIRELAVRYANQYSRVTYGAKLEQLESKEVVLTAG